MSPASPSATAPVREAATVVLLREVDGQLQTWLLRRVPRIAFAPGMSVFAGGKVEDTDRCTDAAVGPIATQLGLSAAAAGPIVAAALRETTEETDVVLTAAQIRPWSRWITPVSEPRRYDTYFFVAAIPSGAVAAAVTTEAEHADWIDLDEALAQARAGERPMLPPTVVTLTEIAELGSLAAVWAAAVERVITPVEPVIRRTASGLVADLGTGRELPLPDNFLTASGRPPA